jgi:hypothetical protein
MFPIYGPADTLALQKAQQRKSNELAPLIPEPSTKDRIVMTALHLSTGGASLSTDRKLKNGLVKFRAGATQMTMDQNKLCLLTRWAVRPRTEKIRFLVDVLEYRCVEGWKGNRVLLKTSKDAPTVKLLKKSMVKGLKPTKTWSKNFNFDPVEEIKMIGVGKVEAEMEIVAREERICSGVEAREVQRRFEFEWWIPTIV